MITGWDYKQLFTGFQNGRGIIKGMKRGTAIITAAVLALSAAGCGSSSKSQNAVPVQSVEMLTSMTGTMQKQIFLGIVSTGNEANIRKDGNKNVAKVNVKKGDYVKAGDVLFTYDAEQAKNNLEKARLELEEQRNTLTSKQEEKSQLEADKQKAGQNEQLDYTLKIQETDTDIRETQYNIGLKEKEIERLEASTKDLDVTAPFDGRIESAGTADAASGGTMFGSDDEDGLETVDEGDSDSGSGEAFIRLVETDNYRIKGTINETNIDDIQTDMQMVIHSRTDDSAVWYGTVTEIDRKSASQSSQSSDFSEDGGDDLSSTSSYPFYVKIDALEGLMIGQHVYMTEDDGSSESAGDIRLPSGFIENPDSEEACVYADANGTIEKRPVTAEDYNEENDTWLVTEGISMEDYIAEVSPQPAVGSPVTRNDSSAFQKMVDELEDTGSSARKNSAGGDEDLEDEELMDEEFEGEEFDEGGDFFEDEEFDSEELEDMGEIAG